MAILRVFVVRRQHYHATRALAGLSDYMLKDMGISRGEIIAAYQRFAGVPVDRSDDRMPRPDAS